MTKDISSIQLPGRSVNGQAHPALGMSALLFAGGALAYSRARSIPSLVAGVSFGTGYAISGWLLARGDGKEGHMLATGLSTLLLVAMGGRYYRGRKLFPAGVLAGAGGISAGYHGIKLVEWL